VIDGGFAVGSVVAAGGLSPILWTGTVGGLLLPDVESRQRRNAITGGDFGWFCGKKKRFAASGKRAERIALKNSWVLGYHGVVCGLYMSDL